MFEAAVLRGERSIVAGTINEKRPNPQLRRDQPDQTPGQGALQRFAREVLLFRRAQRHHLTGMVNGPRARAAAGGDRRSQRVLQGTAI
jgi:hypothetical protein